MNTRATAPSHGRAVDWSLLVVRLIAGVHFRAHGAQKLLRAFGGPGLEKTVEMMGVTGYPVTIGSFNSLIGSNRLGDAGPNN